MAWLLSFYPFPHVADWDAHIVFGALVAILTHSQHWVEQSCRCSAIEMINFERTWVPDDLVDPLNHSWMNCEEKKSNSALVIKTFPTTLQTLSSLHLRVAPFFAELLSILYLLFLPHISNTFVFLRLVIILVQFLFFHMFLPFSVLWNNPALLYYSESSFWLFGQH